MPVNMSNDKNIPTDTEAYYEKLASQEELYLEETEEEVRAILTSDDHHYEPRAECRCENRGERELDWEVERSATGADDSRRKAESLDQQLDHAVEELITGDSDDPPLSEETVLEMLRVGWNVRRLGPQ